MTKIYAHRGMLNIYPENTIPSFKEALKYNIDGIETDIHLTKDNKLVVFHDFSLERMCNVKGYINEYTYEELKKMRVKDKEHIPLLYEVLELFIDNDINLNIELKASSFMYKDIELKAYKMIKDFNLEKRIIFSSFDHRALKILKNIDKNIKVGALYNGFFPNIVKYAKNQGFDAIHPHFLNIDDDIVKEAKLNKILINTYTINSLKEYNYIKQFEVDTIITNIADKILNEENYE